MDNQTSPTRPHNWVLIGIASLSLVLLAAYIAQIIVSVEFNCTDDMTIFSVLYGCIGILAILISGISYGLSRCRSIPEPDDYDPDSPDDPNDPNLDTVQRHDHSSCQQIWRVTCALSGLAIVAMTMTGIYFISNTDAGPNYMTCDRTLFLYTMWNIIGHAILMLGAIIVFMIMWCFPTFVGYFFVREHIARIARG